MVGLGRKGLIELECPFCRNAKVQVFHKEDYVQARRSHIAAGDSFTFCNMPDTYEVLEDCPNCGKKAKEIQEVYERGITRQLTHQERLERMKRASFPTRIEYQS
jgi:hypothetical protein